MEQVDKCKSTIATYIIKNGFFSSRNVTEFDYARDKQFHIRVEQCGTRKIMVTSDEETSVFELYKIVLRIERLLMIFDGQFHSLKEIVFLESETTSEEKLKSCGNHLAMTRISYFVSADYCSKSKLFDFDSVLTSELFDKWEDLLEELDVVHQMYLYALCDCGITVDVKCAFIIELCEPLIEIIKAHTDLFDSLKPGKGTTLKVCLSKIIDKYGKDIFKNELLPEIYEDFLQAMKNSRVRIMHIKREQKGIFFDGKESVLYIIKMSLLYRKIMFEMLDIDSSIYKDELIQYVKRIEKWDNIFDDFIYKLSK